ncbi:CDP-glycerol--glycerophosphate glycerophosphotransferase [Priestia megaterium]|nr:CDP-glycerol--glycerophosphate glycerophosphotransferase [Priestia megaterium]
MVREFSIFAYLLCFRIVFSMCKWSSLKDKTLFVTYFGCNASYIVKALEEHTNQEIVIVTNKHTFVPFQSDERKQVLNLRTFHLIKWFQLVYHLATSKTIMVDNYYGFLAATPFKQGVRCVQLWHAAGAIKKFGFEDETVRNRTKGAVKRFKRVYKRFTQVVVGSDEMSDIFKRSFGLESNRMLKTGIPRTDLFFNSTEQQEIKEKLMGVYPILKEKKVILYAPTFRDNQEGEGEYPLDTETLLRALGSDYVLLLKNHPVLTYTPSQQYNDSVIDVSQYKDVNHLLLLTDILITDYSSIPFEYSLLEKPMIFYAYDLEEYTKTRGIQGEYQDIIPGPMAKTTEEIIQYIQENQFKHEDVKAYKDKWNTYSNGASSKNLIKALYK